MTQLEVEIDGFGPIKLTRNPRSKSIKLRINHDGQPELTAPNYAPLYVIKKFATNKVDWIKKHSSASEMIYPGNKIGRSHIVVVEQGNSLRGSVKLGQVIIKMPADVSIESDEAQIVIKKNCLKALRLEAETILPERLNYWAELGAGSYKRLNIKNIRTRWGSYSSGGNLNLSLFLMQLPDNLIDYILVHELSHSIHLNHSADFWANVEKFLPNYKLARKQMRGFKMRITPN